MNEWTLYWITRLDSIGNALSFITFLIGAYTLARVLFAAVKSADWPGDTESVQRHMKGATIGAALTAGLLLLNSLIPSTKEALIIYGVPRLLQSQAGAIEQAGAIPEKTLKLVNQYLDEHLKEKDGSP